MPFQSRASSVYQIFRKRTGCTLSQNVALQNRWQNMTIYAKNLACYKCYCGNAILKLMLPDQVGDPFLPCHEASFFII